MVPKAVGLEHSRDQVPEVDTRTLHRRRQWAASARKVRARQRAGLRSYRFDLPDTVVEALLISERLGEQEALRRGLVNRALAEVLVDWAKRWVK
jgi:hypothetical protein